MLRIPEGKIVFLDAEFTSLSKEAELISIALCCGGEFLYMELAFDLSKASDWVKENVIPNLLMVRRFSKQETRTCLVDWINHVRESQQVVIVSDCLSYDWVLFCDLFNNQLPGFVYYIPMDLSTMLWMRGIDPDISREEFAGMSSSGKKHRADWDARVIQACFKKLMAMKVAICKQPFPCEDQPDGKASLLPIGLINPPLDKVPEHARESASYQSCDAPKSQGTKEEDCVLGKICRESSWRVWQGIREDRPPSYLSVTGAVLGEVTRSVTKRAFDQVLDALAAKVAQPIVGEIHALSTRDCEEHA